MPTPQIQKVVFRASRRKQLEISAVLISPLGLPTTQLHIWDSQCGHCDATYEWYYSTRPAKPVEYRDELKKLRQQYAPEYRIEVRQKLS